MLIFRSKIIRSIVNKLLTLSGISSSNSWWGWTRIRESFSGAWQRNVVLDTTDQMLSFSAVYACVTGIATDIAKLRIKLDEEKDGIWTEITSNQPWLPLFRKPNHYQTRIQFIEQWELSKLLWGNAYVIKQRDGRGIVNALYVLNPGRVTPLVSQDEEGAVFYRLQPDYLSQLPEDVTVPASEIIHDRMNCLFHPLVGVSPLYACALAATLGNRIQDSSTGFFENRAMPGGMITVPGAITKETSDNLKAQFERSYGGENVGKIAVLSDGMKFEAMQMTAEAAQLAEQLKWTVEDVARAFHYPLFKLGGPLPPYAGNVESLIISYYTDCLQILIESLESCLDEGLALPLGMGTEMDLDNLMRMDTTALFETNSKGVGGGWMKPNEARFKANYPSVKGGDTPYLQQQNYSLAALNKRDTSDDPFPKSNPPTPTELPPAKNLDDDELETVFADELRKELAA